MFTEKDLQGKIYVLCCACMSVYSDFLSWANANYERMVKTPNEADTIIVLGCQVTDLAVLNDLRKIDSLYKKYPNKQFFIGGCLAKREDIELPEYLKRLEPTRKDYTRLNKRDLIEFDKPFWIPEFKETNENNKLNGHLFRHMYPIRLGVGCKHKCKYCTINKTRGISYELNNDNNKLLYEFWDNDNTFFNADNLTFEQLKFWCEEAKRIKRPVAFRNVEPEAAVKYLDELIELSNEDILKILHTPIQSIDADVLKDMGRNPESVKILLENSTYFNPYKTILATNVIIDYKDFPTTWWGTVNNRLNKTGFNYISWNPYWNGNWNREKAERRYKHYLWQ